MSRWTPARVEARLRLALGLKVVPAGEPSVCSSIEQYAEGAAAKLRGVKGVSGSNPTVADDADGGVADGGVADAAEALSWLRWLHPDDAGIVLARLEGAPWKAICWRFAISRPTADRRLRYALRLIAWRLNGNITSGAVPSLRSLLGMRRAA